MNWIEILAEKFKYDENSSAHEGRWRLKDPKDFDQKSYRRWYKWGTIEEPGISFIIGDNLKTKKKEVQAIRFDKEMWTEASASKWWETHKDQFHKTWSEKDWERLKNAKDNRNQ